MTQLARTLLEVAAVAGCGLIVGVIANGLSPRGLSLTRDYFPEIGSISSSEKPQESSDRPPTEVLTTSDEAVSVGKVVSLSHDETLNLFADPRREAELITFLDARSPELFLEGHIPGAFLFYHYRMEEYLGEVLPVSQTAEVIVVYCNGGECEDSKLAAASLQQLGIPLDRLRIYAEGMEGWRAHGQPIELGERLSGILAE